jgi:hypothetical protein
VNRRGTATWTDEERFTFVEQFKLVGKDWGRIAEAIPSKTNVQVRTFYQNNKQRLSLDRLEAAGNFPAASRGSRVRSRATSLADVDPALSEQQQLMQGDSAAGVLTEQQQQQQQLTAVLGAPELDKLSLLSQAVAAAGVGAGDAAAAAAADVAWQKLAALQGHPGLAALAANSGLLAALRNADTAGRCSGSFGIAACATKGPVRLL